MKSKVLWSLAVMSAGLLAMPVQAGEETTQQPAAEQAAPAAGGEAAETKAPAFADVDMDKSGDISETEAKEVPGLSEQWTTLDTSKDGKLDSAEFAAFEPKEEGGVMDKLKQIVE
jgi:hypothetical protein